MSRIYTHPSLKCRADEANAIEYVMKDGNRVLALCRATADEFYATNPQHSDNPISQDREENLFPPLK